METVNTGGGSRYPKGVGDGEYPISKKGRTRCTATNRFGRRCGRYATKDYHLCRTHGGKRHEYRLKAESRYAEFFKSNSTLRDRFLRLLDDPDITDLRPELAIQRSILVEYLEVASSAKNFTTDIAAAVTELNKSVGDLAERVARIEKKGDGWISVLQLNAFVELVVAIITDVISDPIAIDAIQQRLEIAALPTNRQATVARFVGRGGSDGNVPALGSGGGESGED
jgi:hypothetical protein